MAWTTISNALVAVGAKPFATTIQALRDNPVAIAEGASGAPVNQAAWHPFDKVTVGDAATGVIYDFATNGAQASVTANFADGYDYLIRLVGVSGSATGAIQIAGVAVASGGGAATVFTGTFEILAPTLPNLPKWGMANVRMTAGSNGYAAFSTAAASPFLGPIVLSAYAGALASVAIGFSAGNIDAGAIYLYRRRNFMFG